MYTEDQQKREPYADARKSETANGCATLRKTPMTEPRPLTFGEQLVASNPDPTNLPKIEKAKRLFAEIADLLNDVNNQRETSQFSQRLFSHAIGEIVNAQMSVVKVLTLMY